MDRRALMSLPVLALTGLAATASAQTPTAGKIKYTVLYGPPKDPLEFEKHYIEVHMPLVAAGGLPRYEASKCVPPADGSAPMYFRMFEAWFDSAEQMNALFGSPAWSKVRADVPTFATGGVTRFVSKLA